MLKKGNNKGLTLVELIVSIAILAIVVLPLLTAFIVSLRTNAKAKEKLRAVVIAHNFMEGMEANSVESVMSQLSCQADGIGMNLIANNSGVSSKQLIDRTTEFRDAQKIDDPALVAAVADPEIRKQYAISVVRDDFGNYKINQREDGKYYYYVTNIPADDGHKRYAAMITIDAKVTVDPSGNLEKYIYNKQPVASINSVNPEMDAINTDVISDERLIEDINTSMTLNMTKDDLKYLTRTITVKIEPVTDPTKPGATKKKAKVTLSYSYKCKSYPEQTPSGAPVLDADGEQVYRDFVFPGAGVATEVANRYSKVIFDESKPYLRDVYLLYNPWYQSQQMDILKRQDNIVIDNQQDYPCTVKIVKQKSVNEDILGASEQTYRVRVDVLEDSSAGNPNTRVADTKIETNLGTNIADDDSYTDENAKEQAVYVLKGSVITSGLMYNALDTSLSGPGSNVRLWVTKGFGVSVQKDRIYDVKVDIYENPGSDVEATEQLAKIHSATLNPIVSLTGGLIN